MERDKEENSSRAEWEKKKEKIAQHRFSSCHPPSALSVQSRLGVKLEGTDTEQEGEERVN